MTTFLNLKTMSYRLHTLALAAAAQAANLCFSEDFSVVSGQTADGVVVLPTASDTQYLVACGVQGIPFLPQLGHEGGRVDYHFPQPVIAIHVLTTSTQRPIPQAVYTAPAPAESVVAGARLLSSRDNGDGTRTWYYAVIWSLPDSAHPATMVKMVATDEVTPDVPATGLTLAQVLELGFSNPPASQE